MEQPRVGLARDSGDRIATHQLGAMHAHESILGQTPLERAQALARKELAPFAHEAGVFVGRVEASDRARIDESQTRTVVYRQPPRLGRSADLSTSIAHDPDRARQSIARDRLEQELAVRFEVRAG